MNYPIRSVIILLIIFLTTSTANAQYGRSGSEMQGASSFSIGDGIFSYDQLAAAVGAYAGAGPIENYRNYPKFGQMTGAAFITYRYYISNRISIGIAAGLDNQKGDLSYGNEKLNNISSTGTVSGYYTRHGYTIAPEATFIYRHWENFIAYGGLGIAYTYIKEDFRFNSNIAEQDFFYGPHGLVPTNPYSTTISHFNAQVTGAGLRYGGTFAFFAEFGFGYKGIINMGVSLNLGGRKSY